MENLQEELTNKELGSATNESLTSAFPNYETPKYMEDYQRYMYGEKTELQKLAEKAFSEVDDELILGKNYSGRIKSIYLDDSSRSKYQSINIVYEVNDEGIQKIARDSFLFGGEYDEWNMMQLTAYIKRIDGIYFADIDFSSYQTIVNSLQFLIGANIVLYQYLTSRENVKNNVKILGNYNRFSGVFSDVSDEDDEVC
ncbi:MAG: hypothetical protein SOT91_05345 [Bacilli bacterium]|nr:hypothetical protein [Clostridium sp.]MDY2804766.1 hypothetical protein [Bacilli bacterium]